MQTLTTAAAVKSPRRPRVSLGLLRVLLTAHLISVLAQPVLAGLFLAGDVDAIDFHGVNAGLLDVAAMCAAGVAVGYVLVGRGRWWVLPATVLLFLADSMQVAVGYDRMLEWHIPLGVTIVVVSVLLAIWVWSPRAARPRSGGRS